MNAQSLIQELESNGFQLKAEGSQLAISPSRKLTDDLRAKVRTCKSQILDALKPAVKTYTSKQRHDRQPDNTSLYLTDSDTLIDVGKLLDVLLFVCKGRSIMPKDIARYLSQKQIDEWQHGKLTSSDLKQIADELEIEQ